MVRPCWVPCKVDKQHPTGRRTFDRDGWQDEWFERPDKLEQERPRLYPIWGTTADELAVIGGPGVRLYFALLRLVSSVFFLLAVLMTAPIVINLLGEMYNMPAARDFIVDDYDATTGEGLSPFGRTFWARTTLGGLTRCNVSAQQPNNFATCDEPEDEANSATATQLLVYACIDLLAACIVLLVVRRVNNRKVELDELSDAAMISMSDYTVQLRPQRGYWRLPQKASAVGQQQAFKESLRAHVEKHLGKVAMWKTEGSEQPELAIWLAFEEEHRIACWEKKVALLQRLEHALGCLDGSYSIGCGQNKASAVVETPVTPYVPGSAETVRVPPQSVQLATTVSKLVMQLEKVNEELDREEKNDVVCAFVAFDDERDQDRACDLVLARKTKAAAVHPEMDSGALHFAGRDFKIREAPEPDTINFSHLQYSAKKRNMRRVMTTLTLLGVLVGFMMVILKLRSLSIDTAFENVCPTIMWEESSDYALCDGAYQGNFSSEAQSHYKDRWQYVKNRVGTELPEVAKIVPARTVPPVNDAETASCVLPEPGDCCNREHRTWAAAAEAGCTRVWTVDANLSFFPTTRGDGERGLRQCDLDGDCEADSLPPDPGRMPGHRPLCGTMECPTDAAGAKWVQNPAAAEWECMGGLNVGCDDASRTDLERCCTKNLEAEMSKGHSVEAVCYHCICDCLTETNYNTESSDIYTHGCPAPAGGWTSELIATYCADDDGWDEWWSSMSMLSALNSVITTTLNQVLKAGLEASSELEKAHTQAQEQGSLALKVAMAQFTNTVVLAMVSTMYFRRDPFSSTAYPADGLTPWANARWYYQVGTPFMLTMAINQCLPPAIHAVKYFAFRFLQWLKVDKSSLSCGARTQNELNRIYEFNQWKLASSYGEVLFVLSSTLLLCPALPMLLWISAFGMALKYWGDKTAVLRCYLKPPLYSSDLFAELDTKLYIMLAAHLMSAAYFLSVAGGNNPDEAHSTLSGGRSIAAEGPSNLPFWFERGMLTQRHVFPLWISAVAMMSFPLVRICCAAFKGKEYRVAEQRKKKLEAVKRRLQQTQTAMFEALKRRYDLSDTDAQHFAELVKDNNGRTGHDNLKEALEIVLREREQASHERKSVRGNVSAGVGGMIRASKSIVRKAEEIMHKSPVGNITDALSDAVGHAGEAMMHNTAEGLAAAGKGIVRVAAGAGTAAGKVAEGASTAKRSLALGRAYNEEDLDGLDDDDLIGAFSGHVMGLALGDMMGDREVEDPDADLPRFSVAHEQELLVNTHDHYNMEAAHNLLDLQRSFRDTLYTIDPDAGNRLQPKLASVHKDDAGGEKMTMQRMSLAIGVVSPHTGQPLTNAELRRRLRPEMISDLISDERRRGGMLAPIERKKPLFMAP